MACCELREPPGFACFSRRATGAVEFTPPRDSPHGICQGRIAPGKWQYCCDSVQARLLAGRMAPASSRPPPESKLPGSLCPSAEADGGLVWRVVKCRNHQVSPASAGEQAEQRSSLRREPSKRFPDANSVKCDFILDYRLRVLRAFAVVPVRLDLEFSVSLSRAFFAPWRI